METKTNEADATQDATQERKLNYSTKLLAAVFYTRGLWSPFIAWIRLTRCPYRLEAIEWGIDRSILRKELKHAFFWALFWAVLESVLFLTFLKGGSPWYGALFVWLVFLQWFVYPYFAIRSVFRRLDKHICTEPDTKKDCLILKQSESSIPDQGYLLREAIFSVDSTKIIDGWGPKLDVDKTPFSNAESFYSRIESAFSDQSNGISTRRLAVVAAKDVQPTPGKWTRWFLADASLAAESQKTCDTRLLIMGEHPKIDGLATVEFTARIVNPHVTFRIRMRWLPGFKRRITSLGLLRKEKLWWRGMVVPLMFAFLVMAFWVVGGIISNFLDPEAIKGSLSLGKILAAKTSSPFSAEITSLFDVPPEQLTNFLMLWLFTKGGIAPFVGLAALVAFHIPLFFIIALLARFLRFLRGLLYSATGTYMYVGSKSCLRFCLTGSGLDDEESLQVAISYLQIIEQVLTNRIIDVLKENGINTDSIRDELKMFVNEGIYMTGGEFRASNVLVGKRGVLGTRKRRIAKAGQQTIMGKSKK
jgi:hypothetical protein